MREDLDPGTVDNLKDVQRVGIEQIGEGEVLVIDARGDTRAGTMGSILATRLHCRGAAGIVTDGAYRDSPIIAELGIAAYAAAMNAHTNKTIHHPSEIQVPIACGDVACIRVTSLWAMKRGSSWCRHNWRNRWRRPPLKWRRKRNYHGKDTVRSEYRRCLSTR